jgi:alpha-amylase/alpha-mannosidase (GH57 family)
VCIHGHFYQPPRENPWLEEVERQDSAHPYHDWNQRVTAECYAPNAWARILDDEGWISKIVNNYARISFDFGPTLLSWLERHATEVYRAIIEADRESRERFSGHGSALAQAYNHIIMPLANRRDKHTQIIWGIRDFEYRFGRRPEGMWLPETAVDLETLELMAREGLRFTVLAPHQARRVRRPGGGWEEMGPRGIDPTRPYRLELPGGESLAVFFYDASISVAVAFGDLLEDGERFARRLAAGLRQPRPGPQLVSVATDGETFGHHHRFGEMALAYALDYLESRHLARLTNFGEYLERYPPEYEIEIAENTSWSCFHGVERWRADCGCNTGRHPEWSQAWRAPLRDALNWLRNRLAPEYERGGRRYLKDPWAARNDYISVILDRSPENVDRFLARHALRPLEPEEQAAVLKLLEMQRHLQLMYTSCGWFFDDLSEIGTGQILLYAGRAAELAGQVLDLRLEEEFLELLARAKSNRAEAGDGAQVYRRWVRPAQAGLERVAGSLALEALSEEEAASPALRAFSVRHLDRRALPAGDARLVVGRMEVTSHLTRESLTAEYAAARLGGHLVLGCVRPAAGADPEEWAFPIEEAFRHGDLAEVARRLSLCPGGTAVGLEQLFRDQRRRVLEHLMRGALAAAEADLRRLYRSQAGLMRFLRHHGFPLPRAFGAAAEFAINGALCEELGKDAPDPGRVARLLEEARLWELEPSREELRATAETTLARVAEKLSRRPEDLDTLLSLERAVEAAGCLPWPVDSWPAQKVLYQVAPSAYRQQQSRADQGDEYARTWVELFRSLARRLRVRLAPAPGS